eukprot:TRINITY_DN78841_c0_g1_i1.p1 TRINITY_DN78841_c0_g1~~TRINITY_DN78841_c0_g1_i1.p1  ORF type:complete len:131 (-),score=12.14 TRINITY_DN78841_c0_g1_i1:117-509(-)
MTKKSVLRQRRGTYDAEKGSQHQLWRGVEGKADAVVLNRLTEPAGTSRSAVLDREYTIAPRTRVELLAIISYVSVGVAFGCFYIGTNVLDALSYSINILMQVGLTDIIESAGSQVSVKFAHTFLITYMIV